jgi:NAD(P)-dependent dehydrogenase (short-subunit alcohol dehydrogenase family)
MVLVKSVNNAAVGSLGPVLDQTPESIQQTFAVNFLGPIYLMQAAVPHMPPHSRIINIGSVASKLGFSVTPIYSVAKAAMDALTFSMAMEVCYSISNTFWDQKQVNSY